ncbi:hypothetical protein [Methylobacterium oxalidis]|uniref:Uncharacterized protein n=1 Tax=Methylobacterium oxalidis TaxID=944322 RepID=A0A512J2Q6_9HYPH|nr:hypothetical protein [Methylobacterium oxalidis]GEP04193.1 hypothetical protein MOX02_22310 [Methylobacterium oxalidis]GJE31649.1 hypothetical protein LDDCCGHA_1829 [Methylobacterium oxalidis]GLS66679.1 hypothetical protein GCM10007888_50620 [Methylobacterium oxalidis]
MAQGDTGDRPAAGQAGSPGAPEASRALALVPAREESAHANGPARRPLAGFVAHLIVSADPRLRPSRGERTRNAAALYAEAARRRA